MLQRWLRHCSTWWWSVSGCHWPLAQNAAAVAWSATHSVSHSLLSAFHRLIVLPHHRDRPHRTTEPEAAVDSDVTNYVIVSRFWRGMFHCYW